MMYTLRPSLTQKTKTWIGKYIDGSCDGIDGFEKLTSIHVEIKINVRWAFNILVYDEYGKVFEREVGVPSDTLNVFDFPDLDIRCRGKIKVYIKSSATTYIGSFRNVDFTLNMDYTENAPLCGIKIYREDDVYFNATRLQKDGGMAVISKAENRPGSATFTLGLPADGVTYTSMAFKGWSDGVASPMMPGMYCELSNVTAEGYEVIMSGYITTIQPNDTTVSFEMGDGLAFFGKTGSWLRRNYRTTESGPTEKKYDCESTGDGGYTCRLIPPQGIEDTATPSAVYRYITEPQAATSSGSGWNYANQTYSLIRNVVINTNVTVMVSGTGSTSSAQTNFTFTAIISRNGSEIMRHVFTRSYRGGVTNQTSTETIPVRADIGTSDNLSVSVTYTYTKYTPLNCNVYPGAQITGVTLGLDRIERAETYVSSGVFTYPSDAPDDLLIRVMAVWESAPISIPVIMEQMARAVGMSDVVIGSIAPRKDLAYYRVGGAFVLDYMQKLADQVDDAGNCLSFTVDGTRTARRVLIGRRYKVSDEPVRIIRYAGDAPSSDDDESILPISEFNPKLTLKGRPNIVTMNATMSDNSSVCVVFEDPLSTSMRGGLTIESLRTDSGVTDLSGAVNSAYGELCANSLDDWEGTVSVPDIVIGMMSEGDTAHAGSGVPVKIIDSRYGFIDSSVGQALRSRVKQATYDYNQCKTILTIGNFDAQYSSSIADSNALVVGVRDMVTGISDTKLYDQQFVYVRDLGQTFSIDAYRPVFQIHSTSNRLFYIDVDRVKMFELPEDANGDRYMVILAQITATSQGGQFLPSSEIFGIDRFDAYGTARDPEEEEDLPSISVSIPSDRRPDFYPGQTLTLCIMVRRS